MLVQIPPLSFTNVVAEPYTLGLLYVWTTSQDPDKLYITQSIPRLAREVLYRICDYSINMSSLYRSLTVPTKQQSLSKPDGADEAKATTDVARAEDRRSA